MLVLLLLLLLKTIRMVRNKYFIALALVSLSFRGADFHSAKGPLIVTHRGLHSSLPENSIESMMAAFHAGADYVEMDLRYSKDSSFVLMHDCSIDRTTGGKGLVADLYLAQLTTIPLKGGHTCIPSFEDVLRTAPKSLGFYLDFKAGSEAHLVDLMKRYHIIERSVVYVYQLDQIKKLKALDPTIKVMSGLPDSLKTLDEKLSFLKRTQLDYIDGKLRDFSKYELISFEKAGVKFWPDLDGKANPADWDEILQLELDGFQTDDPLPFISWRHSSFSF